MNFRIWLSLFKTMEFSGRNEFQMKRMKDEIPPEYVEEIHSVSLRNIGEEITVPSESLNHPEVEVIPVIKTFDFWSGKGIPQGEYVPDANFTHYRKRDYDGRTVNFTELHANPIEGSMSRHAMIIASAGEGKTTLLKRYAKRVILKQIPGMEHVQLVFYMNFRDLSDSITSVKDVFTSHFMGNLSVASKGIFQWMTENSHCLLFVFDGFDQATWDLKGQYENIDYTSQCSPPSLFYNIFSGHLFRSSFLLTSSRPHALRDFHPAVIPDKTYALAGLTEKDIKALIMDICGAESERIWTQLTHELLALYSLCSTPMFLIFVALVLVILEKCSPDTLSAVVFQVILTLRTSSHAHEDENFLPILHDLKRMALKGTRDKRVLFKSSDLEECGRNISDVKDLVLSVPTSKCNFLQPLVEGTATLFFCHQSVQEALSALQLVELSFREFKEFLQTELDKSHWSVVLRILSGAMLNVGTLQSLTLPLLKNKEKTADIEKKCMALKDYFIMRAGYINTSYKDAEKLEWISCIYETGKNMEAILQPIQSLEFWKLDRTSDLFLAASVASHLKNDQIVKIIEAKINCAIGHVLYEARQKMKIKRLEIAASETSSQATWQYLAHIVSECEVEEIKFHDWCPETEHINSFLKTLISNSSKVKALDISHNQTLKDPYLWAMFGKLTVCLRIEDFRMRDCCPSPECLKHLKDEVAGAKLHSLEISDNDSMEDEAWGLIGEIASLVNVEELRMQGCNPSKLQLLELQRGFRHNALNNIDFSWNTNMDDHSWSVIGEIIAERQVEEVRMWKCQPTESQLKQFKMALQSKKAKIQILEIYDNFKMNDECWSHVGEIVVSCSVCILRMDGCRPTKKQLSHFQNVPGLDLSKLMISGCASPTTSDISPLTATSWIGPEGGVIILCGCCIILPAYALQKPTKITVLLMDLESFEDDSCVRITPVLQCLPSGILFLKPVTIQLKTWCFVDIRAPLQVDACIYTQEEGEKMWREHQILPLEFSGNIQFTCLHFTKFFASLKKIFGCAPIFRAKNILKSDAAGHLVSTFFHDNEVTEKKVVEELQRDGYHTCLSPANTLKIKSNYKVEAEFTGDQVIMNPRISSFYGESLCLEGDYRNLTFVAKQKEGDSDASSIMSYTVKLNDTIKFSNAVDISFRKSAKDEELGEHSGITTANIQEKLSLKKEFTINNAFFTNQVTIQQDSESPQKRRRTEAIEE